MHRQSVFSTSLQNHLKLIHKGHHDIILPLMSLVNHKMCTILNGIPLEHNKSLTHKGLI